MQAHLWSFYEAASVFGKEVHTTGGSRGPSRAFFVPSLSAMQLFAPADSSAQSSSSLHTLSDAAAAQVSTPTLSHGLLHAVEQFLEQVWPSEGCQLLRRLVSHA